VKKRIPVATIAIVATILLALLLPASSLPDGPGVPGLDKLVHALLFLALAVAMRAELGLRDGRSVGIAVAAADIAGFVVGLTLSGPLSAIALRFAAMVRRAASRRGRY